MEEKRKYAIVGAFFIYIYIYDVLRPANEMVVAMRIQGVPI